MTESTKNDTVAMTPKLKRLPARGREPVREWLKSLDAADRRIIGEDVK